MIPDMLMRAAPDGGWLLELNPETLPRVLVNHPFYARVAPRAAKEDRAFLAERLADRQLAGEVARTSAARPS